MVFVSVKNLDLANFSLKTIDFHKANVSQFYNKNVMYSFITYLNFPKFLLVGVFCLFVQLWCVCHSVDALYCVM